MTKSGKSSPASANTWKSCGICRDLPAHGSYDAFTANRFKADFVRFTGLQKIGRDGLRTKVFRHAAFDERREIIGLRRCPLCHTFYLETGENQPDHYASYLLSIDRMSEEEALRELTERRTKEAKKWLADLRGKMGK